MTAVTINGNAYSDDGSQSRDMRFGGHQSWLLPMLQDAMTEVEAATDAAVSADSSAAAALASASNAANYAAALNGTSTSANDIGTGSKTWTTQTGKQFGVGGYVQVIRQSDTTMWMIGQVTAYNTGTGSITVNVEDSNGSGNFSGWDIRVSGKRGAQGATGPSGSADMKRTDITSGTTLAAGDKGKLIRITSGAFTLAYAAAATLTDGWYVIVDNGGGDITHDPNGSETIDGAATIIQKPGSLLLVQCNGSLLVTEVLRLGTTNYLHVRDEKAYGTEGGSTTATTIHTRTLNTVVANTINGASLASSKITLPTGHYIISARAPGNSNNGHKADLYNFTSSTVILAGSNAYREPSVVVGQFALTAPSDLTLRHYHMSASANGLGVLVGAGGTEVYSEVEIWRLQ